ncbi:MAG: hypothetical protein HUU49_02175 [Candidatus Buchananbacteria bacterium]|nr:hypothetical protein [Candidatus Buchananbacteria bacterium]
MKIYFPFNFPESPRNFMRRSGYAEFNDPNTGITSYTKRFSRDFYPRFHAYLNEDSDLKTYINLHLDQKKPSYAGSSAHNGEYDGEVVEKEANRLEGLMKNQLDNRAQVAEKPKSWLTKLFGK